MTSSNYNWQENADREGSERAEKIPTGQHDLEIVRVVFGNRQGLFRTRDGDPQIMLVFADPQGREASQMYTLSDKAGWTLAKLMSAAGANLQRMTAEGVKPQNFAEEQFAMKNLVGRRIRADVAWDQKGYSTITPIRREAAAATEPPADETIPF
ncbi:MAG: hypothetical protein JXL80_05680 [Planctomycetes bacterium]|nr:hypothetical protein [Planctomycetota bacterium]